jgi:hypothetical protein
MKFLIKKYLFYYCYVNFCYCVMRAVFNLRIFRMGRYGIQKPFGVIYCVVTDRNSDDFLPVGVFQRQRELFPSPSTIYCAIHWWKHRRFVSIGVFQRWRELFPSYGTVHSQQHWGKHQRFVSVSVFQKLGELFPSLGNVHS